jgi:hypothetical protein
MIAKTYTCSLLGIDAILVIDLLTTLVISFCGP